ECESRARSGRSKMSSAFRKSPRRIVENTPRIQLRLQLMTTTARVELPIATINPTTGEVVRTFEPLSDAELNQRLQSAADAFPAYRSTSFAERARLMKRTAELLEAEKASLARLMTLEMGKPIAAAVQEVEKCAWGCRFYAENAERFLADEIVETNAARSFVRYQPLGPVLAIMPWNFPFWQVFRFAAPALMAGNVALLKHALNVPQCAIAIEDVFQRAGFPPGVFQNLLVEAGRVERILDDPRVKAASLTGSVRAGSSLGAAAGKRIKKTVLELGGSDPLIVMPSADLKHTISMAVQARVINNGQSCIAATFISGMVERMKALKVGDPMDPATHVGPLARADLLDTLEQQVNRSVQM